MRKLGLVVWVVLVCAAATPCTSRADVSVLDRPDTQGDQLIFYYDARAGFTSFVTIRNFSEVDRTVNVLFYGPTFSTPFSHQVSIAGGGVVVLDAGALRDGGLPAQQGVAFATVVNGDGHPIVSGALTGNFTVANLATGSAWGSPALARSARNALDDSFPLLGTEINDTGVALQKIRPQALELAGFYNPENLAPAADGGNQLIFVTFEDVPGDTFAATIGSTTWNVFATRNNGHTIADTMFTANGVTTTDLASLLGPDVNGASGGVRFSTLTFPPDTTRVIFFAEALGTFGTGYLLPSVPVLL